MGTEERDWAVVTGASAGIGLELVRALTRRGHPVLAVARRKDRLDGLAEAERVRGGLVEPLEADLGSREGVARVVRRASQLDAGLLVNNAAFGGYGPFSQRPLDSELGQIALNVSALVELTHSLVPAMVRRGRGGVINVASGAAFQPNPYLATYGATKAFVLSFSEAVAQELKGTGVHVLAVCPGPVRTEFARVAGSEALEAKLPALTAEQVARATLRAFDRREVVTVVGGTNKLIAFLPRLLPRTWVRRLIANATAPPALPAAALSRSE